MGMSEQNNVQDELSIVKAFLTKAEEDVYRDVHLPRLGFTIRIRALFDDEVERIRKEYRKPVRDKGSSIIREELDTENYYRALIAKATVSIGGNENVTFKHQEFMRKFQTNDEVVVIKRLLIAGEVAELINVVTDLSGYFDGVTEVEDLKKPSAEEN